MRNALRDFIGLCQDGFDASVRWLREQSPVALYRYHRQHCRMGRWTSLRRTLVCWLPSF